MEQEHATLTVGCTTPGCQGEFVVDKTWTPGGVNDYGGWIIQCAICTHPNDVEVGRDVNDSRLVSGGRILSSWDRDMDDRNDERAKVDLPPV